MAKTLCDWSKRDIRKHMDDLLALVNSPRFYCRRCARVANTSKVLCKPGKFPEGKCPASTESSISKLLESKTEE